MSKSLGNAVGLSDPPDEMFGKLMSLSDPLMWRYYELLGRRTTLQLAELREAARRGSNPRDLKLDLAQEVVERFFGAAEGQASRERFIKRFSAREVPGAVSEVELRCPPGEAILIGHALLRAGLVKSTSEALRLVRAGGVRMNGRAVSDPRLLLPLGSALLEVGRRRAARVVVREAFVGTEGA
jgi:tyrosyl-tRNA synthetase